MSDTADTPSKRSLSPGYQVFMLALCLYALGTLTAQTAGRLDPETTSIFDYADFVVCGIFFIDFLVVLARSENRWKYFITWGWIDLLSAIPTIDVMRWGRAARFLRILRVLRGLRAAKVMAKLIIRRRVENTFLTAALIAMMLLIFCSVAILNFEDDPESNIKTAEDAIWWAFATLSTVGYGDHYPVTMEGRCVAAVLMMSGIALCGTVSGFLAAWLLGPESHDERDNVSAEIAALRTELADLKAVLHSTRSVPPPGTP